MYVPFRVYFNDTEERIMKQTACYIRVSTVGQNEAGQRREIERWLKGNGVENITWLIDRQTGDTTVLLNPTRLLRLLAWEGWSNNVEGIAVSGDGSLWLVADNAVTGTVDEPLPPPGDSGTLLLRIPPTNAVSK